MDNQVAIYRVLAKGLLDIRVAAHESNTKVVFHLADLLHNVPHQMERECSTGSNYSDVLEWLRMRAEQKGMTKWLTAALSEES